MIQNKKLGLVFPMAMMLASCGPTSEMSIFKDSWQHRYGPSPTLSTTDVAVSAKAQGDIIQALITDSSPGADYFSATLMGFNFVDEQCDTYMRALFVLNKDRGLSRTSIDAVGQVTSAIMGLTPASKLSMTVVGQAFGLGAQFSDTLFDGYLYGSSPGTIAHVVSEMQNAYRLETAKHRDEINQGGVPVSYGYIRGYLRLCLPSTISTKIDATLANSKAQTTTGSDTTTDTDKTTPSDSKGAATPQVNLVTQ